MKFYPIQYSSLDKGKPNSKGVSSLQNHVENKIGLMCFIHLKFMYLITKPEKATGRSLA